MTKLAMAIFAGSLLLVGVGQPTPASSGKESVLFCPECWVFLQAPGSLDMKGNCSGCGKYPTELNAQRMEWFWCGRAKAWRREPCPENRMKRCCTGEESLAEIVPTGLPVTEAWYCPAHQSFAVLQIPVLAQWRCKICARPAVRVIARERAWFWCEAEGMWGSAPCSMNTLKHCCTKREGFLLVTVESGPIAN